MTRPRPSIQIPERLGDPQRPLPKQSMYFDGAQQKSLELRRSRLVVITAVFLMAFVGLGARLIDLTLLSNDRHVRLAQNSMGGDVSALRRGLVDRNGNMIAADLRTVSLYADARDIQDAQEATAAILRVLPHLERNYVLAKLTSGRSFVWLQRDLTPSQHAAVLTLGLPGLYFQSDRRRVYPNAALVSQVIGYVGVDNEGLAGLEKGLDAELREADIPSPISLTLDLRVQHVLREELMSSMAEFRSIAASGLILNVNTGEILALVSLPDFDPNHYQTAKQNEKFNRVTLGVYEMGSTFKAFNTAMALDSNVVKLEDRFDATKPYVTGGRPIHDFHAENRWLTVSEVFMHSSNIGSARIAHQAGAEIQKEFLERLGLFDRSQLEIPENGRPLLPAKWGPTETATVSFGHGISVSPMQTATAMAALVNGGYEVRPSLVKNAQVPFTKGQQLVSEKTSRQMRRLMRQVVTEGTGKKAQSIGYSVAGKTGTAEKAKNGSYSRKSLLTSFVGVFPSQQPEYLVLVILDEPKGHKGTYGYATAGWNAAPTVGKIVTRVAPMMGLRPVHGPGPNGQTHLAAFR